MPPSGHSSSSHSSHSSGSFGGSSRSSFGGGSSFGGFSSRPSGHSSSSHSSMPNFGSSFGSNGRPGGGFGGRPGNNSFNNLNRPSYFSRKEAEMRFPAPPRSTYNYSNRVFYGNRHQYRYYPTAFILNGINYGAGYYDEDGTYYKNLEMQDEQGNTVKYLTCEYCGCQAEYKPEDGAIPNCTHCGAPLKVDNIEKDTAYNSNAYASGNTEASAKKRKRWKWIVIAVIAFFALPNLLSFFFFYHNESYTGSNSGSYSSYSSSYSNSNGQSFNGSNQYVNSNNQYSGETLYLKKSGSAYVISTQSDYSKKVIWDSSVDSYYDMDTGCWLWYNTNVSPAMWQYWYEGISSEYGDYGWMEYEDGKWYIEVSNGNWQQYTGDTSGLWHIEY